MMSARRQHLPAQEASPIHRDVTSLELFFDLVFVLAVSQLTHHLLGHLGWRGGAHAEG